MPLGGDLGKNTPPKSCVSTQGEASGFEIIGLPNKKNRGIGVCQLPAGGGVVAVTHLCGYRSAFAFLPML